MPGPEILDVVRVVASPETIASLVADGVIFQTAPDEALVLDATDVEVDDPYAIVLPDDGLAGIALSRDQVRAWCEREAEWSLPASGDVFAQGSVAGLPVKVWAHGAHATVICRASHIEELEARL